MVWINEKLYELDRAVIWRGYLMAKNLTGRGGVGFSPPPGTFGLIGSAAGRYGFNTGILSATAYGSGPKCPPPTT